jgi:hypothetical protein
MIGASGTAVLGNGPSIAGLLPGRLRTDDAIVRVNSFYVEDRLHAGSRVDLAFIGGDPRAAPFVAAGLTRARSYRVAAWATDDPRIARNCAGLLAPPQCTLPALAPELERDITTLVATAGRRPTSGVRAVLAAVALGATDIVIAGLDLYATADRYAFAPGPRMRALMGPDYARPDADLAQHLPDLDRRILVRLAGHPGLALRLAAPTRALSGILDAAPDRGGPASLCAGRNDGPRDWPAWAGHLPLAGIATARRLRAWKRQLTG